MENIEITDLKDSDSSLPTSEASSVARKISEAITKSFFKDLASGTAAEILGALGGGIGALIAGTLIKSFIDEPDKQQIINYALIDEFIKKQINESDLDTYAGNIHSTADELFTKYSPLQKNTDYSALHVDDLINLNGDLKNAINSPSLSNALAQLSEKGRLGPGGIPVFMYGVALQICIYQQQYKLYLTYHKHFTKNGVQIPPAIPDGSSLNAYKEYAVPKTGTIALTINEHRSSLKQNWEIIFERRLKQVEISTDSTSVTVTDGGKVVFYETLSTQNTDAYDMVRGILYARGYHFCNTYYYQHIINTLCITVGFPMAAYDLWETLIDNPLGEFKDITNLDHDSLKAEFTPKRRDFYILEPVPNIIPTMLPSDRLYSVNKEFFLEFEPGGDLSISRVSDSKKIWSLSGHPTADKLVLDQGSLKLKDHSDKVLWSTNTAGDNYVFLQDNGMLQVKRLGVFDEKSGSQVQWSSKIGVMPENFAIDTSIGATTYKEIQGPSHEEFSSDIGAIVFKEGKGNRLSTATSLDGHNWLGPYQLPEDMTTTIAPGAEGYLNVGSGYGNVGYGGCVVTLVCDTVTHDINLNLSHPYVNGFGGKVTLANEVGTTVTPAALADGTDLNVVYKGSSQNTNIYQWLMWDARSGDVGKLSHLEDNATNDTPACVNFNGQNCLVYRALTGDGIYFKYGGAQPALIPNIVYSSNSPAAVVCQGKLYVIYRGIGDEKDKVWYTIHDGSGWQKPLALFEDTLRTDAAPAAFTLNNQVFVFVKGTGTNDMYCVVI